MNAAALVPIHFEEEIRFYARLLSILPRACYEVCTKIGAYVGGRSYPEWKDGKQGESRLSERCFR